VIVTEWFKHPPPADRRNGRHFSKAVKVSPGDRPSPAPAQVRTLNKWVRILLVALWVGTLSACEDKAMTDDIYNVKRRNEAQLMSLPGVVSVGIGQDQNGKPAIVVGLAAATPATERRVPDRLGGFPVITQTVGKMKAQ